MVPICDQNRAIFAWTSAFSLVDSIKVFHIHCIAKIRMKINHSWTDKLYIDAEFFKTKSDMTSKEDFCHFDDCLTIYTII